MATLTKFDFSWKIENLSYSSMDYGECITSPTFKADNTDGNKWYIQFYPRGFSTRDDTMSCKLLSSETVFKSTTCWTTCTIDLEHDKRKFICDSLTIYRKPTPEELKFEWKKLRITDLEFGKESKSNKDFIILRCHLLCSVLRNENEVCKTDEVKDKKKAGECLAVTKIAIEKGSSKCNVKLYNSLRKSTYKRFSVMPQFYVILNFLEQSIEVKFERNEKHPAARALYVKTYLTNVNGDVIDSKSVSYFFSSQKEELSKPPSITFIREGVKRLSGGMELDCICCDVFTGGIATHSLLYRESDPTIKKPLTLQEEMRNMFERKMYFDLILRVGLDEIKAHKAILANRSPVLAAMIQKAKIPVIEITDLDIETLNHFLRFLYTNEIRVFSREGIQNLSLAADKYLVKALKEGLGWY